MKLSQIIEVFQGYKNDLGDIDVAIFDTYSWTKHSIFRNNISYVQELDEDQKTKISYIEIWT